MIDPTRPAEVRPDVNVKQALKRVHDSFEAHGKGRLADALVLGELLARHKKLVPHGGWIKWVEANCPFDRFRAAEFIRVHLERAKCAGARTFEEALTALAASNRKASADADYVFSDEQDVGTGPKLTPAELDALVEQAKAQHAEVSRHLWEQMGRYADLGGHLAGIETLMPDKAAFTEFVGAELGFALPEVRVFQRVHRELDRCKREYQDAEEAYEELGLAGIRPLTPHGGRP